MRKYLLEYEYIMIRKKGLWNKGVLFFKEKSFWNLINCYKNFDKNLVVLIKFYFC